jgi:hypothetical protein
MNLDESIGEQALPGTEHASPARIAAKSLHNGGGLHLFLAAVFARASADIASQPLRAPAETHTEVTQHAVDDPATAVRRSRRRVAFDQREVGPVRQADS